MSEFADDPCGARAPWDDVVVSPLAPADSAVCAGIVAASEGWDRSTALDTVSRWLDDALTRVLVAEREDRVHGYGQLGFRWWTRDFVIPGVTFVGGAGGLLRRVVD